MAIPFLGPIIGAIAKVGAKQVAGRLASGTLASIIGAGGSIAGGMIAAGSRSAQNKYNSPAAQLKRLKEAGYPYAAFGNAQAAGQQTESAGDYGISEAGNRASQYIAFAKQQEEVNQLRETIEALNMQNQVARDAMNYNLGVYGTPYGPSRQQANMAYQQRTTEATAKGYEIANNIQKMVEENTPNRLEFENQQILSATEKLKADIDYTEAQTKGVNIDNAWKEVLKDLERRKSVAEIAETMARTGLIGEQTDMVKIQKRIAEVQAEIAEKTKSYSIDNERLGNLIKAVQSDAVKAEFENWQQYNEFARRFRDYLNSDSTGNWESIKAYLALLYTSIAGLTGEAPGLGRIIGSQFTK